MFGQNCQYFILRLHKVFISSDVLQDNIDIKNPCGQTWSPMDIEMLGAEPVI